MTSCTARTWCAGKADKPYHLLTGCEYNTLNLQVTTEAIVQATFGIVGKGLALLAAAPAGATFADPTTTAPMDSFTGELVEGGKTISVVTEIQLTIENGISPKYVVGSKETIRPSIGRCKVTGQVSAYFEDSYLLEKFINEASSSLVFTLTDGEAGNSMKFTIPKIKYTGGQPDVGDEGPITLSMPFQALLDSAAGGALKIERIAHA
ncbi:phage tail tube protein [uncultured Bilophila sp.]|uniref:phage tail tube protein n=2 Tax=Bilophila TaxID=35832 RepID=UPI0025916AD1|nr:phage tail tube protein [uncultured Bilophila sp.]